MFSVLRTAWHRLQGPRLECRVERPVLTTERLTLRCHRVDDAEAWYRLQCEPAINAFMRWPARDRAASFRHLRDRTRHVSLCRPDDFLALAIVREGRLIGDVSLRLKSAQPSARSFEISWMLHPDWEGHGYAAEAAAAVLGLAFDKLGARWVTALIDVHNLKSIALADRLGMRALPLDETTVAYFGTPLVRAPSLGRARQPAFHSAAEK